MGELVTLFEAQLIADERDRRRNRRQPTCEAWRQRRARHGRHPVGEWISLRLLTLGVWLNRWSAPDARRLILAPGPAQTTEAIDDARV